MQLLPHILGYNILYQSNTKIMQWISLLDFTAGLINDIHIDNNQRGCQAGKEMIGRISFDGMLYLSVSCQQKFFFNIVQ